MTFMIDTGASSVAVPLQLAEQAGLDMGMPVTVQTDAGMETGYQTRIKTLTMGAFVLNDVRAVVLARLSGVLIGINVLGAFKITQHQRQMTLEMP
jgi:aspartyl protease family protein